MSALRRISPPNAGGNKVARRAVKNNVAAWRSVRHVAGRGGAENLSSARRRQRR